MAATHFTSARNRAFIKRSCTVFVVGIALFVCMAVNANSEDDVMNTFDDLNNIVGFEPKDKGTTEENGGGRDRNINIDEENPISRLIETIRSGIEHGNPHIDEDLDSIVDEMIPRDLEMDETVVSMKNMAKKSIKELYHSDPEALMKEISNLYFEIKSIADAIMSGNNDGEDNDGKDNDGKDNDGEDNDGEDNDGEDNDGEESDDKESDDKESDGEESIIPVDETNEASWADIERLEMTESALPSESENPEPSSPSSPSNGGDTGFLA